MPRIAACKAEMSWSSALQFLYQSSDQQFAFRFGSVALRVFQSPDREVFQKHDGFFEAPKNLFARWNDAEILIPRYSSYKADPLHMRDVGADLVELGSRIRAARKITGLRRRRPIVYRPSAKRLQSFGIDAMRLGTVFFSPKRSQDREVIAEQKLSNFIRSKLKTGRM